MPFGLLTKSAFGNEQQFPPKQWQLQIAFAKLLMAGLAVPPLVRSTRNTVSPYVSTLSTISLLLLKRLQMHFNVFSVTRLLVLTASNLTFSWISQMLKNS